LNKRAVSALIYKTNLVRKYIVCFLLLSTLWLPAISQYWQQEVNYVIDVSLNDKGHSLTGFEKLEYTNHSPDTLRFIWFHVWPNAYKNDKTAFTDQELETGDTRFYFSDKEDKGYINRLDFKVNNVTAATEDHPQHIDIIKLVLPEPLPPGKKINISTPFHVKLPYNFSRGGHDGDSYQVTQWYPKPAVYDKNGWHPMPYLEQGEFYSEFGSFDVRITVPKNYVVAATGELQNSEEKSWLNARTNFTWQPETIKEKSRQGVTKVSKQKFPLSEKETKTLTFKQDRIHDFAWFADKRFIVKQDSCLLPSGRIINVAVYFTEENKTTWDSCVYYGKDAIRHYSSLVGEYPYNAVSVVAGPENYGGGMEYPMITVIAPTNNKRSLDNVTAHEIGHNWFYGILANNERKYPWLDEGLNSYYETKYKEKKIPGFSQRLEQGLFETMVREKKDQPITTSCEEFNDVNYAIIAYYKTSRWLAWIEEWLGTETFNNAMQEYYRQWQFKHPQPEDLKKVLEQASGKNLDSAFALLKQTGSLPGEPKKGVAFQSIKGWITNQHINKRSAITALPAIGVNSYDKLMIGAVVTNLRLPHNKLQFLFVPMYATGSKRFAGIGFINHSFYPNGVFRKIDIGANASTFTADSYEDPDGNKTFLAFQKIVPHIKLTLKEKNPRSTLYRFIRFRSYLIGEDNLRFYRDSIITPTDTTIVNRYRTEKENRTLHQLQFVIENNRVLYPYKGELKIEQGEDFVRTAFTGNYFFNYPKGGGLTVRLFAGKFFYTVPKTISKQFATDRYHLNMTGANGYEDYTYSDYFIGRNKFEGFASQQIMVRDGAFKVRTDLLADKVGRTDDWLAAVNLSTTIPSAINPLSVLPVKIPLKIFVDIGSYAEAWEPNADLDRFLFDAGLQISLLKETVNIYIPLVYSQVFKDYILSTIEKKGRFWKKISFSIDISNFTLRKIDRRINF
jgi:hypothetical protein